jgi:predicted nucleic acid-binding protein
MNRILVDTSAWFALVDEKDYHHREAVGLSKYIRKQKIETVLTDHIFAELITLIRVRMNFEKALTVGNDLYSSQTTTLTTVDEKTIDTAWGIFSKYTDKDFSFVDCISFTVMEQMGIDTAFSFDDHFRQIGKFQVLGIKSTTR